MSELPETRACPNCGEVSKTSDHSWWRCDNESCRVRTFEHGLARYGLTGGRPEYLVKNSKAVRMR